LIGNDNANNTVGESKASINPEQEQGSKSEQFAKEKKSLPENVTEYIQKVRDELKQYEENRKFYEKKRKKEIVLQLIDLLEEHEYPKEWLRIIIAQELEDYISTSYIEKILAERYPDEEKKVKKQSTTQITEIPRNDDKIPMELSTTGEIIVDNDGNHGNDNPYDTSRASSREVSTEFKTDSERQAEGGAREVIKILQKKVRDLETRCYQLDQLAQEGSLWKEKYTKLQQEFSSFKNKIIKGTSEIEFGSEFVHVKIEYNFRTNQFSARIPEEVIKRILGHARRQGEN
jgi:acyl carrier protein phosphodiesterase